MMPSIWKSLVINQTLSNMEEILLQLSQKETIAFSPTCRSCDVLSWTVRI